MSVSYAEIIYADPCCAEKKPQRLEMTDVHGSGLHAEAQVVGQRSSEIFLLYFTSSKEQTVRQNFVSITQ